MRKKLVVIMVLLLLAVAMMPMPTEAMGGACENFVNSVTNSSSQAFWYAACSAVTGAWEMFYEFF